MTEEEFVNAVSDRGDAAMMTPVGSVERVAVMKEVFAYEDSHPNRSEWANGELIGLVDRLNEGMGDPRIAHYALTGPDSIAGRGSEFVLDEQSPLAAGVNHWLDNDKFSTELLDEAADKVNPLGFGGLKGGVATLALIVGVGFAALTLAYAFYQGLLKRATRAGAG